MLGKTALTLNAELMKWECFNIQSCNRATIPGHTLWQWVSNICYNNLKNKLRQQNHTERPALMQSVKNK